MTKDRNNPLVKRNQPLFDSDKISFVGSVVIPSIVLAAIKTIFELIVKIPGKGNVLSILIENGIFLVLIFFSVLIVFLWMKRKIKKLDSAPQVNDFIAGNSIDKFRPIEMRTPSEYPIHPDFLSAAKSLQILRFFLLFSTGGMSLIVISSILMGMSGHNTLVFLGFLATLALPVWYVFTITKRLVETLRENSFHLAHSEIYELDLISLSRDFSQQHMMYKLCIRLGNTLKNYNVLPLSQCDKNFSELSIKEEDCPRKISCHVSPVTGEPVALATKNGPVWLSNVEVGVMFLPPRPGTKILTLARPIKPLEFESGIKLLADKSKTGLQNDRYTGTWQGLSSFDRSPYTKNSFYVKLAQAPSGELRGTYHSKLLGPLYGKVTVDGKAQGNDIYLNVVYHFWLWKWFEKPELWAGIYDPDTKKITGTFKKANLTGIFVMLMDDSD